MDTVTILLAAALFLIACLFLYMKGRDPNIAKHIDKIPGPFSIPIFGSALPFLFIKRNQIFKYIQVLHDRFTKIFRTWGGNLPEVHIKRPEDIEVILKSSEHLDKGHIYRFLHEWLGTGLLTSTGQKWHSHRKMITPTFHFKILDSFVEVFSEKSEILVEKLKKEIGSQSFDVYPYITKCALDIICETAMGTEIYAQDNRGADYVKAVYDMSEVLVKRSLLPWFHSEFLFKWSSIGKRHDECLKVLHGFTKKVIRERKAQLLNLPTRSPSASTDEDALIGKKKRKAFLDLLLEASFNGVKLTDEELREEVDTFMFEGHDTTSAGMCWALFLIGQHPEVQDKIHKELDEIFQGSQRSVTMKDLNEMKYLERVIKEALRIYPSVPIILRKLNQAVTVANYNIPAGCNVVMHIYNVHRNPDHFPNPEKFDPDNFLPERVAKRHPYAYIPFSAGPRNCIGQKFAILEEKTVLSYILRTFKLTSLNKREDINLMAELVLRPEKGIEVRISERNK